MIQNISSEQANGVVVSLSIQYAYPRAKCQKPQNENVCMANEIVTY